MPSVTIAAIDVIGIRLPLDIWAPAPLFAGKPRTSVDTALIRVTTDTGLIGWGEAYGASLPMIEPVMATWIRPLAIGQRADDANLTTRIERTFHGLGRSGSTIHALAGLDIALWDLRGKLEGVPVSALLGGAKRTSVECYASLLQYNGVLDHVRRNTERAIAAGFRHIKLHERTPEAVAAARAVTGPDIPIMVDVNCAWTLEEAIPAVSAMAASKPFWVEEPIWPPEDFAAMAKLRKATGVPLAAGENATGVMDFAKMADAGAVDFVQPSVVKIGGLTNLWKIATAAEAAGLTCAPHAFFVGPGALATLHALACTARPMPLERLFADLGYTAYHRTVPLHDGAMEVPQGPGLGADPDTEMIERFKI